MEEEAVSGTLKKSLQSSKEFVAKGYHNLADFFNKTYAAHKEKGHDKTLKMAFAKYVLVFLDIFYMVTSLVMINIGTIGKIIYRNSSWYELNYLSTFWIATGIILLIASIFGLIGAFKESNNWTNVFGVLMTIVFITQISSAIFTFQFIGKSQSTAGHIISRLMDVYSYGQPEQMDWIQRNFQCCGNDGPSDWNHISKFERSSNPYRSYPYYYQTTTAPTLSEPLPDRMPSSCCVDGSNYINSTCDKYYQNGCSYQLREVISSTVMIVGSVALAIAVFEILGIVFAFVVAKIMRKTKSLIAIQHYEEMGDLTVHSDASTTAGGDVGTI